MQNEGIGNFSIGRRELEVAKLSREVCHEKDDRKVFGVTVDRATITVTVFCVGMMIRRVVTVVMILGSVFFAMFSQMRKGSAQAGHLKGQT